MQPEASEKSSGKSSVHQFKPTAIDVFFLAMTITLGGQYRGWTDSLPPGFWGAIVIMLFNGIGYVCFAACMAEMAGTLPFSGGVYGFVRAFLGPLSGYIVSRFEIIMVICYVALLVQVLGTFPTTAGISTKEMEPLWWLFFYVTAVGIALVGCNYVEYWVFIRLIGGFSLIMLIIYILGSFASVNYDTFASGDQYNFSPDFFMICIFQCAGMFRGVQFLPLVSMKVNDPKTDIPRGMFISMLTLFFTAFGLIFTSCTQAPGTIGLKNSGMPLNPGYMKMFNLTAVQVIWLNFPALYGNFYGFVWAYGKQLASMAKSGLLPEFMGWMTPVTDTPWVALVVGSVISFSLALICYNNSFYYNFTTDMKYTYALSSYVIYDFMFISYIIFKHKYTSLARSYSSPFGIYGAFVGLGVFAVNTVCVLIFIKDSLTPLYIMLVTTVLTTLYYFLVLHGHQQFSEEEKEKLFKAYLINANQKSRHSVKKRNKAAMSSNVKTAGGSNRGMLSHSSDNSSLHGSSRDGGSSVAKGISNSKTLRSSADSPSRNLRKNNQVIPEADESMKKEGAVAIAEPVIARLVEMGKLEEDMDNEEEEEVGVALETTSLVAGLSGKYNLSGKLSHLTDWMTHNTNIVTPQHDDQQQPQQLPHNDVELGKLVTSE